MDEQTRATLQVLFGSVAGGFLAAPPGLDGDTGLGIAGVTGAPRARGEWEVAVTVAAPGLPGDELTFVALEDGTLVVDEDIPDGTASPLADAVEQYLSAPYRAAALRKDDELWAVAAARVMVHDLPSVTGDAFEATRLGGEINFAVDGVPGEVPAEVLRVLEGLDGDCAVTAERIDDRTWVAEAWRL